MNWQRPPSRDKRFVGRFVQRRRYSPGEVYELLHVLSGAQGKILTFGVKHDIRREKHSIQPVYSNADLGHVPYAFKVTFAYVSHLRGTKDQAREAFHTTCLLKHGPRALLLCFRNII